MFELKYDNSYQSKIYEKYNIEYPREDYYLVDNNIFCVADGVTRDLAKGKVMPYPKTKEEAQYIADNYPNPSGAFSSSKIIATNFVKYIKENQNCVDKDIIKQAVKKANEGVWEINRDREIDYIEEDLYCSEAVGGIITEKYLYCFSIGDCYIKIFDYNNNEIFATENDHMWMENFEKDYLKSGEYNWFDSRYRLLIRGALRNNYIIMKDGKHVGYGALTGEESAMNFVKIYKVPLEDAKYICVYSDGCMEYFESKEKLKEILEETDIIKQGNSERTLVIYERK